MPFSLVNRVFHQACHTRITDSTGLIVFRGLPKTQEKSSTSLPFSPKSCTKVTNVTFPRSRGKTPSLAKFDAGRRQSGEFRLRRDARHSRVPAQAPAFHRRHANLRNKLFRIFRTLSDGKSQPAATGNFKSGQQNNSNGRIENVGPVTLRIVLH